MTRIFVVRHGQTEWNREERFRGRIDIPLNDTGLAQARLVADWLARGEAVEAVYAGPLRRARDSAAPIAARFGLPVQVVEGLNDLNFGDWQGLTPGEVAERYPDLHRRYELAPHTVRFPGGESLGLLRARVLVTLDELANRHAGGTIVLVSHKVTCKSILLTALNLDDAHYWQVEYDNAAISLLEHRGGQFVLWKMNQTCHLGGG